MSQRRRGGGAVRGNGEVRTCWVVQLLTLPREDVDGLDAVPVHTNLDVRVLGVHSGGLLADGLAGCHRLILDPDIFVIGPVELQVAEISEAVKIIEP